MQQAMSWGSAEEKSTILTLPPYYTRFVPEGKRHQIVQCTICGWKRKCLQTGLPRLLLHEGIQRHIREQSLIRVAEMGLVRLQWGAVRLGRKHCALVTQDIPGSLAGFHWCFEEDALSLVMEYGQRQPIICLSILKNVASARVYRAGLRPWQVYPCKEVPHGHTFFHEQQSTLAVLRAQYPFQLHHEKTGLGRVASNGHDALVADQAAE